MKKAIRFLTAACCAALLLSGCPAQTAAGNIHFQTAAQFYAREKTDFEQSHLLDSVIITDSDRVISAYAAEQSDLSGLVRAYREAEYCESYPVYGTYLEPTDMAIYVFYTRGEPTGIGSITVDSSGNAKKAEYKAMSEPAWMVNPLSLEQCYGAICGVRENYPDFEICGLVYSSSGYPLIYPIGSYSGSGTIAYVYGEPTEFRLVEPFSSVEEGRALFREYQETKSGILERLYLSPWKQEPFYETGYLSMFASENAGKPEYAYLSEYDSQIAIPILSASRKENVYILHLLYCRNQLIAEIILQNTGDNIALVFENAAQKDTEGNYIPIRQSEYEKISDPDRLNARNWLGQQVIGICFDGELSLLWGW